MNVSAHRTSTAEVQSALVGHSHVAETAVVGATDGTTGQAIIAFVILVSHAKDRGDGMVTSSKPKWPRRFRRLRMRRLRARRTSISRCGRRNSAIPARPRGSAAKVRSHLEGQLVLEQQDPEHPRGPDSLEDRHRAGKPADRPVERK
jgi:acyl-CoA synthetase (AMP-forming)/AMP-acid ligase II